MGWNEASTIQAALLEWAQDAGWEYMPGSELPRDEHDVVVERWAHAALLQYNPDLVDDEESADMVLADFGRAVLDAQNGLVAANEALTVMLRGQQPFVTVAGKHVPRRFIDFDEPENNKLVVADEVTIKGGRETRRFDVVYYVNGFPLVVVETKTPVKQEVSWFNAAKDIYDVYEVDYPQFFATNAFNVATEGLELRMAPVRAEPDPDSEFWAPWGETGGDPRLSGPARVERDARTLLTPAMVLAILRDFAMYRHARDASEQDVKLLPRYPQVEAAVAIHDKVLASSRNEQGGGGLVWHHQGSGKTELMAFTAARLLRDERVGAPTVIVIADRKDLVRQTAEMFRTAGMPTLEVPKSKRALWSVLKKNGPRVVVTTPHKFAEAGHLTERSNIIVLVDEAHRSQEGSLGKAWRTAVPNATFFGMTGTAIKQGDRDTFKLFGNPDDPDLVLSRYTMEHSIADGFTKPVIVEGRAVKFALNKDELDEAFDELAEVEDLDEDAKEYLSGKASHIATILKDPERVTAVCADIVDHYLTYVAPLGQKAQVVAYNQELVVAYATAIEAELQRRAAAMSRPDGTSVLREVGVVMHVENSKDTPVAYKKYLLSDEAEEALKRRFKKVDDPLSFVVITAKWMTGFNAPIEGVLYLDKPLKAANLFQTITRPNRPWKNPLTGQRKEFGRVVDYIGLAKAIGDALLEPKSKDGAEPEALTVHDVATLVGRFMTDMTVLTSMFAGIDMNDVSFVSLAEAYERIPAESDARATFVETFTAVQRIWEFLDPNPMLAPFRGAYLWLARLYESIQPKGIDKGLLWTKLGAKTEALIHAHMTDIAVKPLPSRNVTLDAAGITLIRKIAQSLQVPVPVPDLKEPGQVVEEILDSIEARLKRRLGADPDGVAYRSLAERIEKLRQRTIESVEESLQFLQDALDVAHDVVAADRAAEEGTLAEDERLYDPKIGALTRIVSENTPKGLHKIVPDIVHQIDEIVLEVSYTGWTESDKGDKDVRRAVRGTLNHFGLPVTGVLFDKTYEYVKKNY
jgi:type I restriction enzyme R subunit